MDALLTTDHSADTYAMLASQLASLLLTLANLRCDYTQSDVLVG